MPWDLDAEPVTDRVVVAGKVPYRRRVSAVIDMPLRFAVMEAGEDETRAL
jgi:hypothetical protein